MGILNITINDLPESDVFPAGQYRFRIDDVQLDEDGSPKTDKKGTEYIGLGLTIVGPEGNPHIGRKHTEGYIPLSGKATLRRILMASEFEGETLATTDELVALEFDAVATVKKDEEYGEQNRISTYIIPGRAAVAAGSGGGERKRRR